MYRFLLSRQWVILTLVALVLIPVFVQAGNWQYQRHDERVARNDLVSGNLAAEPVPVDELTGPGAPPADDDRFRTVTVTGVYAPEGEAAVRQRVNPDSGEQGYHVVTPLEPADGGAPVLVNRGWVSAGDDPTALPDLPPPPAGEVTVTGRLMADETDETTGIRERDGLPDGMIMMINSAERTDALGTEVVAGHVELAETRTADGAVAEDDAQPMRVPAPDHTGIGAHFAYALQWWFFAAMVPVGWVILLRREARDRARADEGGRGGGATTHATPPGADPTGPDGAASGEREPGPESRSAPAGDEARRRLDTVG